MEQPATMTSLYRVLAAIGFDEPTISGKGMPTIAWPDTRTGVTLPAEDAPEGWETLFVQAAELRAVESVVRRLDTLRLDPMSVVQSNPPRVDEPESLTMSNLALVSFYRLLKHCGFSRPTLNESGMPTIAWPDEHIGIAFPSDVIPAGWAAVRLTAKELTHLGTLLSRLNLLHVGHRMRSSGASATRRISSDEQELLSAMLRLGIPEPDRNLNVRDENGKFRGVADFAWEFVNGASVKVVLEVDGWHWHVGRDMADEIMAAASADRTVAKEVQRTRRAKGAVDAAKRRVLQLQGWTVIVVHDTEITKANVDKIAGEIKVAIDTRRPDGVRVSAVVSGDEF